LVERSAPHDGPFAVFDLESDLLESRTDTYLVGQVHQDPRHVQHRLSVHAVDQIEHPVEGHVTEGRHVEVERAFWDLDVGDLQHGLNASRFHRHEPQPRCVFDDRSPTAGRSDRPADDVPGCFGHSALGPNKKASEVCGCHQTELRVKAAQCGSYSPAHDSIVLGR
jgi:hypothetical protein